MSTATGAAATGAGVTATRPARQQKEKLTLYWLSQSRSHRILWLLEELQLEYELKIFMRGKDMLAPPELRAIHPLGKSPVLAVQPADAAASARVIAESGLIVEYLLDHYGQALVPRRYADEGAAAAGAGLGAVGTETEAWMRYRHFMHYTEGSLMPFMVLALIVSQIRTAPVPFFFKPVTRGIATRIDAAFLDRNIKSNLAFLEDQLASSGGDWFAGPQLTGADIMLIFPLDAGRGRAGITPEKYPRISAWVDRCKAREAFKRATAKIEVATGQPYVSKL